MSLTITSKKTQGDLKFATLSGYAKEKPLGMSCSDIGVIFLPVARAIENGKDLLLHHRCSAVEDFVYVYTISGKLKLLHLSFGGFQWGEQDVVRRFNKKTLRLEYDLKKEGKNIQRQDLLLATNEYLSGKPIGVNETSAFGCSIKRK